MRVLNRLLIPMGIAVCAGTVWLYTRSYSAWQPDKEHLARAGLPGDAIVVDPVWTMSLQTGVHAPASAIWPWLVQIGYQRGGLYSYDWLDRVCGVLDAPSSREILPEFQDLRAGDVIPLGAGPDWPVAQVDPERALVLEPDAGDVKISWAFLLTSGSADVTTLTSSVRATYPQTFTNRVMFAMMRPAAFLMTRKMLLGIKQRAEGTARAGHQ